MKNTSYVSLRVNSYLYEDFKLFCENRSITISAAFEVFILECCSKGTVPFKWIDCKNTSLKYLGSETRKSIFLNDEYKVRFNDFCSSRNMSVAFVFKAFMYYCVTYNPSLPYSFDKN